MKVTKVEYTVREDFVETNKTNIGAVMQELRSLDNQDVKYMAFLKDDGKSFMHLVFTENDEAGKIISSLSAFQHFREALNSGVEVKPVAENFSLVDSSE
jgi:hypothetical protein